jgi:hypothetical protein
VPVQPASAAQIVNQNPNQPTKIPVSSEMDRRLAWHVAAWWALFILLLASWFAIGMLVLNETNTVRHDAQQDTYQLGQQISESATASQSRIDQRAGSLDTRIDQLLRDNALLRSELSALEVRVASQESTCRAGCSIDK